MASQMVKISPSKKTSGRRRVDHCLELHKVLGNTAAEGNCLAWNHVTGDIVYSAGSTIVVYDPEQNKQVRFFMGRPRRRIACLHVSSNGQLLVAGEAGRNAAVLVWDLNTGKRKALLLGHDYGIACVCFDHSGNRILSLGVPADGNVVLWDWRQKNKDKALAFQVKAEPQNELSSITWSADDSYFVTAGKGHVTHWALADDGGEIDVVARSAKLGLHKDAHFNRVMCGVGSCKGYIFALSKRGILCAFKLKQKKKKQSEGNNGEPVQVAVWEIEKWVDLRLQVANLSLIARLILLFFNTFPAILIFVFSALRSRNLGNTFRLVSPLTSPKRSLPSVEKRARFDCSAPHLSSILRLFPVRILSCPVRTRRWGVLSATRMHGRCA